MGPFDRWPTGNGFEHFYGFIGGETDQWYPTLTEGTSRVDPWGTPEQGYHLTEDLTDKAIAWINQQKALAPDRPFFVYFAPGATHAPHHVPKEWADKYKGRFDHGWDAQREQTLARQKELGVIPHEAELTKRHDEIPAWEDTDEAMRPVLARQMENYAGFLEHTDHHVGRLIEALEELEILDDTVVYVMIGDNGASAEGTLQGEIRPQFCHVIDVAPTVLDVVGLPQPTQVNGVTQRPMEGVSMAYSFDDASAPERHDTQYFEIFGNRGMYHRGWSAVTKHRTPWLTVGAVGIAFDDDIWELYDGSSDWTQARDLSKEHPEKLHELQRLFTIEAARYNVLPLDDRSFERVLPEISGKPEVITGNKQLLLPDMGDLTEQHMLNTRNRSWSLTAQVAIDDGTAEGVILSVGGQAGGWSFYLKDRTPTYCYNLFGIDHTIIRAHEAVPAGEHQLRMEFAYDGGGHGKGGNVTLYLDGANIGDGRIEHTEPIGYGAVYTDVGRASGSPVTDDYTPGATTFTGSIKWIELESGDDSHDHLIDPEMVIHAAMYRQ